jgi:AraC family ethanolamine operon transcriptional activator
MEQSLLAAAVRAWVSAEFASQRPARVSSSTTSICQRTNSYLQEHQGQLVYIADICAALGIPDRCLNLAFQKGFGISPIAYLRLRRLRQAHEQLQADSRKSTSVKAIAYDAGFGDLSRFATYYRQTFGELPHETFTRDPAR